MNKIKYNTQNYEFREKIQSLYNSTLESLHQDMDIFNAHTDQSTDFHKIYYSGIADTGFYEAYKNFISTEIPKIIGEPFLYQRIPTFRVHMKGNLGVGEFHKDSDYSHSTSEINVFLPVTEAYDNNTIWVESSPGKKDYTPMNCKYGEFYMWDGANLLHGNKLNDTDSARVSFDFRLLRKSDYNEDNVKSSITNNTKMILGEYWAEL